MKRLVAVRLINWYHFSDQTLRLAGTTLLMGDSGSGKSTVLDAIQLALVADVGAVRFNKAANENSRRSLYGYVRHKLGTEDQANPGQLQYGRNACTSYVLVEFQDDSAPEFFVAGIAMDATESDSQVARTHFVMPQGRVDEVPVLDDDGMIRPTRLFRTAARTRSDVKLQPDVTSYREELRQRLGVLPESFHRLIVKALDFKPIGQVRQFVFDYLLDERRVNTESLQTNLENYKRLESESRAAAVRLDALDALCDHGERIANTKRTIESHQYVSLRATYERLRLDAAAAEQGISSATTQLESALVMKELAEKQIAFLDGERLRIERLLQGKKGYQQLKQLEADLARVEEELEHARQSDVEARRILDLQRDALESLVSGELRDLRRRRPEFFGEDEIVGVSTLPEIVARLRQALERTGVLRGRDLTTWGNRLGTAHQLLAHLKLRIDDIVDGIKRDGRELEAELRELDRDRRLRYDDSVAALLHLLRAKLNGSREPQPLCELIEVPNDRWRNAVEGYLNTRRFDVIVAPDDFDRALSLYERHKTGYHLPGRGQVFIGGVGLVDVARIQSHAKRVERASLALQIDTDDQLARAYCDYLLGEVVCCDSERELRRHSRSITDTVMVYQNYVARQTPRHVYATWYLGQRAVARRRAAIEERLAELSEAMLAAARDHDALKDAFMRCDKARLAAGRLAELVAEAESVPDLEKRAALLSKQISAIDKTEIDELQNEQKALETELDGERKKLEACNQSLGSLKTEIEAKRIVAARLATDCESARNALTEHTDPMPEERRAQLGRHYEELVQEAAPGSLAARYEAQRKNMESRLQTQINELVRLKTEYASKYEFACDLLSDDWSEFAAEREIWRESHLPAYRNKISTAKEEAIQQLAEDVIFKLRENLIDVRRQLDDLNSALRDVSFGTDRYSFEREVARDHKQFYDLIMEASQFEKESLFGAAASSQARQTLEELFERLVSGDANEVRSDLEARADYREYFNYDIRIHHANKTYSSFDKVSGDKSGGETQTPYYIAIFASVYRMYKRRALGGKPACGLLLLDEAFAKMDESRTRATLDFARELGLQLIIAAAQGKSEFVAPGVETTLLVVKDPASGLPTVLDFTKEFHDDGRRADQDGDPAEAPGRA